MARHRRTEDAATGTGPVFWRVGKYIRLSREDGNTVSESVVNQDRILNDDMASFFPAGQFEVVDAYIDDGTSGTTDSERAGFQRMVGDVKAGRINCIMVKNLSRAFRNSADQGRFLEEFLPLYGVRFISLYQPRMDTYLDAEIVHSLEVSLTGFMNEQYAYKTSADVRRTFRHKRENGEFIGAFAPYGYRKDPQDKNALLIDEEAAQTVRDIYAWFTAEGLSKSGIAKRLNRLGVPNRAAYKRAKGFRYENPHAAGNDGKWSPAAVSQVLRDPLYTGVLRQGRQRVVSYKIHTRVTVPESEWYVVDGAVPPIVSRETFDCAQALQRRDTRAGPGTGEVYPFAGLLRCADCQKAMHRTKVRDYVYYVCRTYREKGKTLCTRHTTNEKDLYAAVLAAVRKLIPLAADLPAAVEKALAAPAENSRAARLAALRKQRDRDLERARASADELYTDWKNGDVTREQYRRIKAKKEAKIRDLQRAISHIKEAQAAPDGGIPAEGSLLASLCRYRNVTALSRSLLTELVDVILVHGDKTLEIRFKIRDPFHRSGAPSGAEQPTAAGRDGPAEPIRDKSSHP